MDRYVILQKKVGQTPLACAEAWRAAHPAYSHVPLAYAGRLDPMASGALLVLIGDECKRQTDYHSLDKEYEFSVLFGIGSDTGDVLGRLTSNTVVPEVTSEQLSKIAADLIGSVTFPYPNFSSKTVHGKPLHTWTLEGRLHEIDIPTITSDIYSLSLTSVETRSRTDTAVEALAKIETIPPVTDPRKALGNDFRRADVRIDWDKISKNKNLPELYTIATFSCIASSGTYMRTLAEKIARLADTNGLAWHIHRSQLGRYDKQRKTWSQTYVN